MNIRYSNDNNFVKGNSSISFALGYRGDPYQEVRRRFQERRRIVREGLRDVKGPPRRRRGKDVRIGMIVGAVLGGIGSWLLFFSWLGALYGSVGGAFFGRIIGLKVGQFAKKRRESKNLEVTAEEKPDFSGPFKKA